MKMIIMMLSITSSSLFLMMKHPLSMGFMLLLQTMLTCLINGLIMNSFWFSYILFITLIGGMLVLFIYMASIASNEKFKFSSKLMIFMLMMNFLLMLMYFIDYQIIYINNVMNEITSYNLNINLINKDLLSMNKMFNLPSLSMSILMIIYLLITMISVVKITNIKEGPLRMKN